MESNVICQGFLEQETCDILEKHFDLQKELGRCTYGDINKIPQGKSFDLYGDSFCEAIGVHKTAYINKLLELNLSLTYGLMREYERGAVLKWHRDRWQCEYSVTIQISKGAWPIHFADPYIGGRWEPSSSVILQRGDAVFYKGYETFHGRDALKHETSRHLFLHYVEKNSPLDNKDSRPNYGMLPVQNKLRSVKRKGNEAAAYNKNTQR